jgi:hypothetical protein
MLHGWAAIADTAPVTQWKHMQLTSVLLLSALLVVGYAAVRPMVADAASDDVTAALPEAVQASSGSSDHGMPSAADIDAYLAAKGSPMAGSGAAFVTSGTVWRVDPRLLVAIAGAESSFGRITCGPFNAWGYGCPNNPFGWTSWADAIDTVARGLRTNYLAEGRTSVLLIQRKYAPSGAANDPTGLNNHWVANVSRFLLELGGDPQDVDLAGVGGTLPIGPEYAPSTAADGIAFAEPADRSRESAERIAAGTTISRVFRLRNAGTMTWTPASTRVRRVDIESRLQSAPYAVLVGGRVRPGEHGTFAVQLANSGGRGEQITTAWRLEGPAGPAGPVIERRFVLDTAALTATDYRVQAPERLQVRERGTVVVTVRNAGLRPWKRDGQDAVVLGIPSASGPSLVASGWLSATAPARMLQREVAPGADATFAFHVVPADAGVAILQLQPFSETGWASGERGSLSVIAVTG